MYVSSKLLQFYHFNHRWRATYLRVNKQSIHKFILCKVQSFVRLSNEMSFTTTELSCLVIKTSFSVLANFAAFASLELFETKQTKKSRWFKNWERFCQKLDRWRLWSGHQFIFSSQLRKTWAFKTVKRISNICQLLIKFQRPQFRDLTHLKWMFQLHDQRFFPSRCMQARLS